MSTALEEVGRRGWSAGDRLHVRARSAIYKGVYECEVLAVEHREIRVAVPMDDGKLVFIPVGTSVELAREGEPWLSMAVVDRLGGQDRCLVLGDVTHSGNRTWRGIQRTTQRAIAVTSGKGGVGKSTLVTNLGIALARRKKRICIIDADLGTANVDVLLNLTPRYTLADVISGERSIFEVLIEGPQGLVVLPGGSGLQELTQLDEVQFTRLMEQFHELEAYTDMLLIDTGSGLSRGVTNFIVAAGEAIVVTTPEPPAITDAYALIKVLAHQNAHINLRLVVNRVTSGREADEIAKKMIFASRRFLHYELSAFGFIVEDSSVGRAVREQMAVVEHSPRSRAAMDIEGLASVLSGEAPVHERPSFVSRLRELLPGRRPS